MSNKRIFNILLSLSVFIYVPKVEGGTVVPQPYQMEIQDGIFRLQNQVTISIEKHCTNEEKQLSDFLENDLNLKVNKNKPEEAAVCLTLNSKLLQPAGSYLLTINKKGIVITASERSGLFYGIQTLKQLIEKETDGGYSLPYVKIEDKPRFQWRAMLLDEARTFQGKEIVKQLIKEMSLLKMNKLQWHLTDDQGWRIEIKKYPLLTSVNTDLTLSEDISNDQKKGYYTQEEIKEIVEYAQEHHVTIIPEIEMPGHASAAITAYPWLGSGKKTILLPVKEKPVKVSSIYLDIFDVSDKRTITFLENVLDEVGVLFPGKIIHIGGDEVNFSQWKSSEAISGFMKKQGIASPAELQRWVTNRMSRYLSKKGIRMMGWNDIMGQNIHGYKENQDSNYSIKKVLSPQTIVHFWKGDPALISETVMQGYDVVNAYHLYTYMDYDYQSIPLEKAYNFEPVPETLPVSLRSRITGLSCQMWGGSVCTVETHEKLYRQLFPRLAAYAEVGWTTKENKDWIRFQNAINKITVCWKKRGIRL